jgi:hypothetical protein
MAGLLATAEKYAIANDGMLKPIRVDAAGLLITESSKRQPGAALAPADNPLHDNRGKKKDEQPDGRYGSRHVAAVEEAQSAAEGSRCQKGNERPWKPKLTYEQMLDAPCSHHSGVKLVNHTNRQCNWTQRLRGEKPPPAGDRRDNQRGRDDRGRDNQTA